MSNLRKKTKKNYDKDTSLRQLAQEVTYALKLNEDGTNQRQQVELLMSLETTFRKKILKHRVQSREIYKKFIIHVSIENRNILSARPFFREKAKMFSSEITPAIRDTDIVKLQSFHINFNLIKFIKDNWIGDFPEDLQILYADIEKARTTLIENNLPLAINRAKLFFNKTPKSHLELMDLINIAVTGLVSGVDKWVGEYTKVFNGVCIGRMTGNMIDNYSETTLHFYPSDKTILYRANSLRFRNDVSNLEELADLMNLSYEEDKKKGVKTPKHNITSNELSMLLCASSPISIDIGRGESETDNPQHNILDSYVDHGAQSVEDDTLNRDGISKMLSAALQLSVLEQKVLKLKGIKF